MVSPSASAQNPRRTNSTEQTLQRRLAAASASSAGIHQSSSSSSVPRQPAFYPSRTRTTSSSSVSTSNPVARSRSITPPSGTTASTIGDKGKENAATDPGTPRTRHRRAAAQAQLDLVPPNVQSLSLAPPKPSLHPSRALYETIHSLFNSYLAATSTSQLLALGQEERAVNIEQPRVFITSWVDYTHKYGTAYSLTDGTAGLYFNDSTTMVLSPDKE